MLNFKSFKEMKKVLLFCVVAVALASCAPKAKEEAPKTDSTAVVVDSLKADSTVVADTTAVKK